MIACTVVMAVQTVGLILVIALLTIPAYVAQSYSKNLKQMMFFSCLFSVVLSLAGLVVSYVWNLTVGPTIILFSVLTVVAGEMFLFFQKQAQDGEALGFKDSSIPLYTEQKIYSAGFHPTDGSHCRCLTAITPVFLPAEFLQ